MGNDFTNPFANIVANPPAATSMGTVAPAIAPPQPVGAPPLTAAPPPPPTSSNSSGDGIWDYLPTGGTGLLGGVFSMLHSGHQRSIDEDFQKALTANVQKTGNYANAIAATFQDNPKFFHSVSQDMIKNSLAVAQMQQHSYKSVSSGSGNRAFDETTGKYGDFVGSPEVKVDTNGHAYQINPSEDPTQTRLTNLGVIGPNETQKLQGEFIVSEDNTTGKVRVLKDLRRAPELYQKIALLQQMGKSQSDAIAIATGSIDTVSTPLGPVSYNKLNGQTIPIGPANVQQYDGNVLWNVDRTTGQRTVAADMRAQPALKQKLDLLKQAGLDDKTAIAAATGSIKVVTTQSGAFAYNILDKSMTPINPQVVQAVQPLLDDAAGPTIKGLHFTPQQTPIEALTTLAYGPGNAAARLAGKVTGLFTSNPDDVTGGASIYATDYLNQVSKALQPALLASRYFSTTEQKSISNLLTSPSAFEGPGEAKIGMGALRDTLGAKLQQVQSDLQGATTTGQRTNLQRIQTALESGLRLLGPDPRTQAGAAAMPQNVYTPNQQGQVVSPLTNPATGNPYAAGDTTIDSKGVRWKYKGTGDAASQSSWERL